MIILYLTLKKNFNKIVSIWTYEKTKSWGENQSFGLNIILSFIFLTISEELKSRK